MNGKFNKDISFFKDLINLFEENKDQFFKNDTHKISEIRKLALEKFSKSGRKDLNHQGRIQFQNFGRIAHLSNLEEYRFKVKSDEKG